MGAARATRVKLLAPTIVLLVAGLILLLLRTELVAAYLALAGLILFSP